MTIDRLLTREAEKVRARVRAMPRRSPTHLAARRRQRAVGRAVMMIVLIGALAAPAFVWLRPRDAATPTSLPQVVLGDGQIWPDDPVPGSPVEVAQIFAAEVLGWQGASAYENPPGDPAGPVWVTLDHEFAAETVTVLTSPLGEEGRVLLQITTPFAAGVAGVGVLDSGLPGTRLGIPTMDGASTAHVTIRFGDDQHLTTEVPMIAQSGQVRNLEIDVEDPQTVRSVLVRYLNAEGHVVAAVGGLFSASDEPQVIPNGPLGLRLLEAVDEIPALASLHRFAHDQVEDGITAGMVSLTPQDQSGNIDFVYQHHPNPAELITILELQMSRELGPAGETLLVKDLGHTLQAIAIDPDGRMMNVTVFRIGSDPQSPLSSITLADLREWAVNLLNSLDT